MSAFVVVRANTIRREHYLIASIGCANMRAPNMRASRWARIVKPAQSMDASMAGFLLMMMMIMIILEATFQLF